MPRHELLNIAKHFFAVVEAEIRDAVVAGIFEESRAG